MDRYMYIYFLQRTGNITYIYLLKREKREILYYSLLVQSHNTPLPPPKKNSIFDIVLDFSWDMSQEKLQTMIMQILGGKRGVLWDCASRELKAEMNSFM